MQTLGSGQRLDATLRKYFEPRFGQDFSDVRVHTDVRAAAAAKNLGALAYTAGEHIVFGAGRYAPQTSAGRKLIAHELTHVVQQGSMGRGPQAIQRACGAVGIGTPTGCEDHAPIFVPGYPTFRFTPNCDDFAPGEQAALVAAATALPASAQIEIHGFASPSGSGGATFDQNVSCARALQAQSVLTDPAPAGAGMAPERIAGVFSHGPTPGPASGRSVVVMTPPRAAPVPATVPTPGATDFEITRHGASGDGRLFFKRGVSTLTESARREIRAYRASPPAPVRLVGYASADEAASVAQDRADAVEAALTAPARPAFERVPAQRPVTVSESVGNAAAAARLSNYVRARSVDILIGDAEPSIGGCTAKDPIDGAVIDPPCADTDPKTWIWFHLALLIAEEAMKRAVASVSGTPTAGDAAVIDRFFGNHSPSTLKTLRTNLANLAAHVESLPKTTVCRDTCDSGCEKGPIAYTNGVDAGSVITLCIPRFRELRINDAARNLIHESAHATSPLGGKPGEGTEDYAYKGERMFPLLTPADRLRNSDSYALFALHLKSIEMTGLATASPAGITGPITDDLPGFGSDEPALRMALARLEKRLSWAKTRSGQLHAAIHKIRNGQTTWADSPAEDSMREAAARFPLTAPPATPSLTDETRVAAILDRYVRMHSRVRRKLTATRMRSGVVIWPVPAGVTLFGDPIEIGPDLFRATPDDQVALLLEALAHATPDVEPAFLPAYVSMARWWQEEDVP